MIPYILNHAPGHENPRVSKRRKKKKKKKKENSLYNFFFKSDFKISSKETLKSHKRNI